MIVLASQSPRRKQLMELTGFTFIVKPSDADEIVPDGLSPVKTAEYLSKIKAEALYESLCDGDIIIGADTIVTLENEIFGKPSEFDDAFKMLKRLSGKTHNVITGVTVIKKGADRKEVTFSSVTGVKFFELSDSEITSYISTNEPYDKAGGYGIQEKGGLFVEKINGDWFNVVGLPIARLVREINNM